MERKAHISPIGVPRVSVIVPIYNVENYLRRCVDSIIMQTFEDLEIILVDDGSPDGCPAICDEYARQDSRVRVLHKPNGGLSDARNTGIEFATGEYLAFIDSDDWIDADTIELLYTLCLRYDVPLAECSYRNIYSNRIVEETDCTAEIRVEDSIFALSSMLDWKYFKSMACNKLYHHTLFDNIRFPKGLYHEDEYTTYKLFWKAKKLLYVDVSKYNYDRSREDAITFGYSVRKLDCVFAFRERLDFIKDAGAPELEKKLADAYCWVLFENLYKCHIHNIHPQNEKLKRCISCAVEDADKLLAIPVNTHYTGQLKSIQSGYKAFIDYCKIHALYEERKTI